VKLKFVEAAALRPYQYKPYIKGVPFLRQNQHDNNKEMPGLRSSLYHCAAGQSHTCEKTLNDMIERRELPREKRGETLAGAFKRIHEELIPDVMLFTWWDIPRRKRITSNLPRRSTANFSCSNNLQTVGRCSTRYSIATPGFVNPGWQNFLTPPFIEDSVIWRLHLFRILLCNG